MAQISSLTLRRATDDPKMVASMLELARASDIKAACPRSDTFCLPRVKCPVKSVVYDREGQRFMEGPDKVIYVNQLVSRVCGCVKCVFMIDY